MKPELSLLPRYIKNKGLWKGCSMFINHELLKRSEFRMAPYPHQFFMRPGTTDLKVFREVFLFQSYQFNLARHPEVIIDAGANVGFSSVFFANRYPDAKVYAIEPDHSNFTTLKKNTAGYPSVQTVQTALWHSDAALKIRDKSENEWAFTVEECDPQHPDAFPAMSVSSLMQRYGIAGIDLLKLDIEGAEREIFSKNYEDWLPRTRVIVIELHDWMKEGCSATFFQAISRYKIKTMVHEGMLVVEIFS